MVYDLFLDKLKTFADKTKKEMISEVGVDIDGRPFDGWN